MALYDPPKTLQVRVHSKLLTLTTETIQATREWFATNAKLCVAEAQEYVETGGRSGTRVNDLDSYIKWGNEAMEASLRGDSDHTFAFIQRAVAHQTGECVPLLTH